MASLESLQQTLKEFLELMSEGNTSTGGSNHTGPQNVIENQNSMTSLSDYRKRFEERPDIKKVSKIWYHCFL